MRLRRVILLWMMPVILAAFPTRVDALAWEALVWIRAENRLYRVTQGRAVGEFDLIRTVPLGHWSDVAVSPVGRYFVHSAYNHETGRFYHTVYDAHSGELLVDFTNEGGLGSAPRLFGTMVDERVSQVAFATIVSPFIPQESEILVFDLIPGQRQTQPAKRLTSAAAPNLQLETPIVPIVGRFVGGTVTFFLFADPGAGSVVGVPSRWNISSGAVTADALYQPPIGDGTYPPDVLTTYLVFALRTHPMTGETLYGGRDVQIEDAATGKRTPIFRGRENTVSVGRFIQGGAQIVIVTRNEERLIRNEMGDYEALSSLVVRVVNRDGRVQYEHCYAPDALPSGCDQPLLVSRYSATGYYYTCEQNDATAIYHRDTRTALVADSGVDTTPLYVTAAPAPEVVVVWVGDTTPERP